MQKYTPDEIARFVTGRLLDNTGTTGLPWQEHPAAVPEHALTGQSFTGINVLLLWQATKRYSLNSNRWLTGDDLRQAGGTVIPGQKPVTLVRYRPALSLMKVINLAQCEGLPDALQPGWPLPPQPAANRGVISSLVTASGIPVVFREGTRPVYRPLHDRIPKGLGKLTPLEQLMVFSVVMVAGLETTRNAIAGGILAFIHHPDQWLRLQQDGGLMNSALDELLRWTSPTPYNRRTATRDVVIGDRLIRRGEKVTLWWASANRDDTYYEQPFAFDIGRQKNLHMAFGSGGHSCLGSQLARLEMRVILLHLLDQVDGFRLDGDVNWVRSNKHTGIRSMLVRFVKRY